MADSSVGGIGRGSGRLLVTAILILVFLIGCIVLMVLMRAGGDPPATVTPSPTGELPGTATIAPPTALPPPPPSQVPTVIPPTVAPPPSATPTTGSPPTGSIPPECWPIFLDHGQIPAGKLQVLIYNQNTVPVAGTPPAGVQPLPWALEPATSQLGAPAVLTPAPAGRGINRQVYYALNIDQQRSLYMRGAIYIGDRFARPLTDGICWNGQSWQRVRVGGTGLPDPVVGK